MEVITLNNKENITGEEVLLDVQNVDILVQYVWVIDSVETVRMKGPNGNKNDLFKNCSVKIVSQTRTMSYDFLEKEESYEVWNLFIDGKLISGDVESYNINDRKDRMDVVLALGWG